MSLSAEQLKAFAASSTNTTQELSTEFESNEKETITTLRYSNKSGTFTLHNAKAADGTELPEELTFAYCNAQIITVSPMLAHVGFKNESTNEYKSHSMDLYKHFFKGGSNYVRKLTEDYKARGFTPEKHKKAQRFMLSITAFNCTDVNDPEITFPEVIVPVVYFFPKGTDKTFKDVFQAAFEDAKKQCKTSHKEILDATGAVMPFYSFTFQFKKAKTKAIFDVIVEGKPTTVTLFPLGVKFLEGVLPKQEIMSFLEETHEDTKELNVELLRKTQSEYVNKSMLTPTSINSMLQLTSNSANTPNNEKLIAELDNTF